MPLQYQNPGAAFSGGIDAFMAQKAAEKRQAMMDQLAIQREADQHEVAMQALQEKKDKVKADLKERDYNDTVKKASNIAIGDIQSPEDIAKFKQHGVDLPMSTTPQLRTPTEQPAPGIIQSMGGLTPNPTQTPMPMRFMGSRAEQDTEQGKKALDAYIQQQPVGSVQRKVGEAKQAGLTLTGAEVGATGGDKMVPVMTREQALKAGSIPSNTKIEEPLQPKDTTARDANLEAKADAARTKVYNTAVTELDKRAKPFEDQQVALNNLGVSLAQKNNPKADALVAIELLKGTVAGGGVRLTQPEITSLLGGSRTKWDTLSLKMNTWGGDPNAPLVLTDGEKEDMRVLARALRTKAHDQLGKITKARHKLDGLDDPREIQKAATALQEELDSAADEPAPIVNSPALAAGPAVTHVWHPGATGITKVGK